MGVRPGDVVSVRHYSSLNPFRSVVQETSNENVITIKLTKEFAVLNCFEGDPVVLGYEIGNEAYIASCSILELSPRDGLIRLRLDNVDTVTDRRVFERFPVSFYADIRTKGSKTKHPSIVKTLSLGGMMVCSKAHLEEGQEIEIDMYMDTSTLFLGAVVVRKVTRDNIIEYGLKTVYKDYSSQNTIRLYLQILKSDISEHLNKMKE